jgi:hypothetical protein
LTFLLKRPPSVAATPTAQTSQDQPGLAQLNLVALQSLDGDELARLIWTNAATNSFQYVPVSFRLTVDVAGWRLTVPLLDAVELELPPTWVTDRPTWRVCSPDTQLLDWIVTPNEAPVEFDPRVVLRALKQGLVQQLIEHSLTVEIRGVSQFDPASHALKEVNNVDGWGVVEPEKDVFERTYRVAFFPAALFSRLYRSIVFLGGSVQGYGGGLCTGMARAALERSLSPTTDEPSLDQVLLWHGRQLTNRALLASAPWFLLPSPRRAFRVFRREMVESGTTTRCFDIAVPKPWRADIATALQREGHTVVPYAFRQSELGRAEVSVYDPNEPQASIAGTTIMTFDLEHDTYAYRGMASLDNRRITVIAVDQAAYRCGQTAMLSGLASWLLQIVRARLVKWQPFESILRVARTLLQRA